MLDELIKMCSTSDNSKAYYRPFICNGELSKVNIFFVGINPATPIFKKDLEINEYVRLLLNYDEFINYYKKTRLSKGKTEFSRTRIGINAFMEWLNTKIESSILETNIITYPTENIKLLRKEPINIIENGKDIFYKIFLKFTPTLLILHGKETVIQVIEMLNKKGLLIDFDNNLIQPMEQIEKQVPFIKFVYPNGKTGYIVSCRHFMYYGKTGNSYTEFKNKLEDLLNIN